MFRFCTVCHISFHLSHSYASEILLVGPDDPLAKMIRLESQMWGRNDGFLRNYDNLTMENHRKTIGKLRFFMEVYGIYPLVDVYITMENHYFGWVKPCQSTISAGLWITFGTVPTIGTRTFLCDEVWHRQIQKPRLQSWDDMVIQCHPPNLGYPLETMV